LGFGKLGRKGKGNGWGRERERRRDKKELKSELGGNKYEGKVMEGK